MFISECSFLRYSCRASDRAAFQPGRELSEHLHAGDGNHELASPGADELQLLHDFVLEIPGKNHDIIRLELADAVGMIDRDAAAGKMAALFVRAAVHGERDQVLADAA